MHVVISGRYEDRFELIDERWRLVDRFVHSDLFGDLSSTCSRRGRSPPEEHEPWAIGTDQEPMERHVARALRRLERELARRPEPTDRPLHRSSGSAISWSTSSVGEALQGTLTPLTWSFWEPVGELAMRGACADLGILPRHLVELPSRECADDWSWAVFVRAGRVEPDVPRVARGEDAVDVVRCLRALLLRSRVRGSRTSCVDGDPAREARLRRWVPHPAGPPPGSARLVDRLVGRDGARHAPSRSRNVSTHAPGGPGAADVVNRVHILNAVVAGAVFDVVSRAATAVVDESLAARIVGRLRGHRGAVVGLGALAPRPHPGDGDQSRVLSRHGFHGPAGASCGAVVA